MSCHKGYRRRKTKGSDKIKNGGVQCSQRYSLRHGSAMLPFLTVLSIFCSISVSLGFSTRLIAPRRSSVIAHASIQTINGETSNQLRSSRNNPSRTLTPYEILHPASFPPTADGSDREIPLHACLQFLQQALDHVARGESRLVFSTTKITSPIVIRIQHTVSHPVDPLCWLHAQTRQRDSKHPTVYFANAEQTLESAVYGSAYTHRGSSDEFFWNLVRNLPDNTHIYGGERFDPDSQPSEEWKEFGSGLWILPAVELRQKSKLKDHHANYASEEFSRKISAGATTIAVHLCFHDEESLRIAAQNTLDVLMRLSDRVSNAVAPTTLPPVISRESSYGPNLDGQEIFESGVAAALEEFETVDGSLQKVVLARRMDLRFDPSAELNGLDMLRKWKFGGHEGGHLFYLNPGVNGAEVQREFVGCTPERLFQIQNGEVISEALAGTRPRGSTQEADEQLSRDLFQSPKDREENLITGRLIRSSFQELYSRNWVKTRQRLSGNVGELFVRRLRHLQHICQRFRGTLRDGCNPVDVSQYLLESLHPTPAVGGYPGGEALRFIRDKESFAFDRGYYAGPFGCFGNDSADIVVAIRSSLITRATSSFRYRSPTSIGVYAGAGIVPGSTLQNEWAEISYKLGVVTSLFPQSPFTLQSASTPNVAWANSFIEELIRCGVTQFYVCPGSRSTPLVAALAKALRANVGFLHALSVHDERGAGFRALGYGRGSSRPAAVITSSGTAISNLYPAIMEAGMDGVPMMILTADRPYENRATGANQAVDQVKAFSSTYIRWFRDIPPPSDDVPVSLALSDAGHAVHLSRQLRGPVHLNIQFRENLAPDSGPIRNDNRVDSMTAFNGFRFTDVPGFHRWAAGGGRWTKSFSGVSYDIIGSNRDANVFGEAIEEIAQLIRSSRRGIVIVGNLRTSTNEAQAEEDLHLTDVISYFAQAVGFPIIAGVQSGSLRFRSPAVIPYAEHVMKSPAVSQNMNPDFVLQIGSPLVSTEVVNMITSSMKERTQVDNSPLGPLYHVLLHPHHPTERSDPSFTISHRVSSDISSFLKGLLTQLEVLGGGDTECSSDLAPLVLLGRKLGEQIPEIIHDASRKVSAKFNDESEDVSQLTEPQVALAMAQVISNRDLPMSLFLSNSMPVRDAEFFLYPTLNRTTDSHRRDGLFNVGVNRGASGIDGIISSACGFAEACDKPTTLLIGDLAALHDINALHTLVNSRRTQHTSGKRSPPLTTVVVNNDGGGIFSFLPIVKHGSDVNFDEFFGTPTNTFSFEKGAAAFGLKFHQSASFESFVSVYERALSFDAPSVIEAVVTGRDANVAVHQEITRQAANFVSDVLGNGGTESTASRNRLPVKRYSAGREDSPSVGSGENKTLLLLHGWMGDKSEWDHVGDSLAQALPPEWTVLSADLPGHGDSELRLSSDLQAIRSALGLTKPADEIETEFAMDDIAGAVLRSLSNEHGVPSLDAIAGYSLGGRVALAMQRLCETSSDDLAPHKLVTDDTKMIILSSNPGTLLSELDITRELDAMRIAKDDSLSRTMLNTCNRAFLGSNALSEESLLWSRFLESWYNAPLWGGLQARDFEEYEAMVARRTSSLSTRGQDLAAVLRQCSPGRQLGIDWKFVNAANTLYVAGALDKKYSSLGRQWSTTVEDMNYVELPDVGHALLTESPLDVAGILTDFILDEEHTLTTTGVKTEVDTASTPAEVTSRQLQEQFAKDEMYTSAKDYCDAEDQERCTGLIGGLEYEFFTISLENERRKEKGIVGVGWGDKAKASESNRMTERTGLILNIFSSDGSAVGVGEVSPLAGLHPETLKEAESQVTEIKSRLQDVEADLIPDIHAEQFLALDGALGHYLDRLLKVLDIKEVGPSVRSGLEMALISLASQNVKMPILQALTEYSTGTASASKRPSTNTLLPLSGLIMRGRDISMFPSRSPDGDIVYPSLKVKVGHQTANEDALSISSALQETERGGKIRADANRAWDEGSAIHFAAALEGIDVDVIERLEFIEEPLQKVAGVWSLEHQVEALERWHKHSGIPYALDESLADLADSTGRDFEAMRDVVRKAFSEGAGGCAAFVLKPTLLGLELSMRLARMAHNELGIGAVFSSSFDSGVGLAYTAFLAAAADASVPLSDKALYSHGVGTFSMLAGDTLSPSFASYVTDQGRLQVASLSRAFFGLGLDDMRDSFVTELPEVAPVAIESEPQAPDYRASAATSSSGREISVVVSLPLPFSDDIACSRFSDLPQQSRWSPWLSSVAYLDAGRETEWTLNVRGVRFSWRAVSSILEKPYKGIMWESVSGLKNMGVVEFVPTTPDSCTMKVRMTIITPRVVTTLFPGASVFAEDFLQNKLLKWSLEMFRDVVKGDLALERGDVELGDALFGAVEGRANAIEATLSNPLPEESPPGDVDN